MEIQQEKNEQILRQKISELEETKEKFDKTNENMAMS